MKYKVGQEVVFYHWGKQYVGTIVDIDDNDPEIPYKIQCQSRILYWASEKEIRGTVLLDNKECGE